ncbi:hypothetical protein MMC32_007800 [Xylographa parallela]|nr:hypothetical protein [Xylographa parallela]
MVYIRQKQLEKLHPYKYAGVDHSLTSKYILKPFYTNVAIKCFPMSMAPNAITLSGFGFVLLNFLTLLWYNPTLDQDMPRWVRRTHQSGPLGELFDHGVDACNTAFETLLFAAAMNMGQSWKTVLTLFGTTLTFYVQTWDEYYTQTLTLGLVSGPVEGILSLCIVYAITAVKGGGSYWQQSMLQTFGITNYSFIPEYVYEMQFSDWLMVYGGLVLVANTTQSALHVLSLRKSSASHTRTHESPLLGLAPIFVEWTLVALYLYLQPVILNHHLVPFVFYVGLINAYSVGQIIVAHLTKNPNFPYQNVIAVPLGLAVLDSIAFMFACLGMGIGIYGSFVVDIITTICDYLDIWCLTIKHPYNEKDDLKKAS